MATVSSIVVRRRLATMRQVEEALARQTLYGGDVVTNLLDVAPPPGTDEAALTAALAESTGLPAASLERLREPDSAAVARVARNLAEHHGFVPIAIRDGAIVLAVAEPFTDGAIEEIETSVGAKIALEIAPTVRLRQALERAYGVAMDRRSKRLAAVLDGSPGSGSVPPPRRSIIPDVPDDPMVGTPKPAPVEAAPEPTPTPASVSDGRSRPPPPTTIRSEVSRAGAEALKGLVRRDSSPARRRKGPFTRTDAEKVFADAASRDAVLSAVLEFSQQWFAYVAIFHVHDDLAEGWEASGSGPLGERVRKMGVPLDLPSLFSAVREARTPVVRARPEEGLDAVIAADLERPSGGDVVVAPVVVGKRVVALLYADDAGSSIVTPEVAEVFAVIAEAGAALAKLILRKKGKGIVPLPKLDSQPPRDHALDREVVAERAAVLARALAEGRAKEKRDSVKPPPGQEPNLVRPAVKTASLAPIVSPTAPLSPEEEAAREPTPTSNGDAAVVTKSITKSWEKLPLAEPPPPSSDGPTGLSLDRASSDLIPAIRDLEKKSSTPELVLPQAGHSFEEVATPVVVPRSQKVIEVPTPRQAPPPSLAGRRSLGPVIPREDPDEAATPLVNGETVTSEPEMIEAAEVSDAELEELLELAERNDSARKRPSRPSERFEVYEAREPPRPTMRGLEHELPKVIVAIEPEMVTMVANVIRGGAVGEKATSDLRELGVAALPAIMDRFPGPTRVDRTTPIASVPTPAEAGPLLALLVGLERLALRDVLARTGDPLPETRFWATWLLTEIVDLESSSHLVPRLVDDDLAVRRAAWAAGRALLEQEPSAADVLIEPLVGVILDPGGGMSLRIRSANALGELRDRRAVEGLIFGLDAREPELSGACHEALVTITRANPVAQGETWPAWLAQHGSASRIEWLIDALLSEDATLREAASNELKAATKVYVGYYANLPRTEREEAWRRYRTWWKEEGKRKFEGRA